MWERRSCGACTASVLACIRLSDSGVAYRLAREALGAIAGDGAGTGSIGTLRPCEGKERDRANQQAYRNRAHGTDDSEAISRKNTANGKLAKLVGSSEPTCARCDKSIRWL
jgi:hypothetical protein